MIFHFEDICIDTDNFSVEKSGKTVSAEPLVFDLVVYLIKNRDRLVTRQELLDTLWSGRHVSDTSLSNHIKNARKALGDNGRRQQFIQTIHTRGYRFIAEVEEVSAEAKTTFMPRWGYRHNGKVVVKDDLKEPIPRIAVLPLSNTRPDAATDYFGFAISDQIVGELAYLKKISVRPSSSIRKYSEQVNDPVSVGKELDVDYVLSGSHLKEGNTVRLNIELVEVETNRLVWRGKQIEVNYQNVFKLQDVVARWIVEGLNVEFEEIELKRIGKSIASDPLAYEYYFRSISYPYTTDGHQLAIEMLSKSIELDPGYAPAYAQLGNRLCQLEKFGLVGADHYQDSEAYYLKALALDPELISALAYLAMFYTETNRIDEAMKFAQKMYEINPTSADTHFVRGYIFRYAGMVDLAIQKIEKAVAIDPKNPKYRSLIGMYSTVGQYQAALDMLNQYPESPFTLSWKGIVYYHLGEIELANNYYDQVIEIDAQGLWGCVAKVQKAYLQGEPEKGFDAINQLNLTTISDGETIYYVAAYYGLLGDGERCIQTLKEAVDAGYFNYPFIEASSTFDEVREQPEFREVVESAKQKHYAFRERYFNDYADS